jgi:hypothetical protein
MDPLLKRLFDIRAIEELSYRYARGVDRQDGDALEAAFTPDAIIDYGFMRVPVAAMAAGMRKGMPSPTTVSHHLIGNVEVVFDDEEHARATAYVSGAHRSKHEDGKLWDEFSRGRYLDTVVIHEREWRIASRVLVMDWSYMAPAGELEFWDTRPGGEKTIVGKIGKDDPSYAFFA